MMRRWILLLFVVLFAAPVRAQEETPTPAPPFDAQEGIALGGSVTGQLDNRTPRTVYYFDALRGDVVTVRLAATDGNLDPVLVIFDSSGEVLSRSDDRDGSLDSRVVSQRIPRSDRYYVAVGRFGYDLGTTSGDYELGITRDGISSDPGSVLRYGDSVTYRITSAEPQVYYSFRAEQGDIVNIYMQQHSGDLDPYLQVLKMVDNKFFVVAYNDDVPGSNSPDALIANLLIEESGTYVIEASRYGQAAGNTTGSFVLSLEEAENSGLGNSALAPVPIQIGSAIESSIDDQNYQRYFTFQAHENDIVTVRMSRAGGRLDAYLILADSGLNNLIEDDDSGGGQNAKIAHYLIPADGTYYIIATRYQRRTGTTSGNFQLEVDSEGNAFDGVPQGVQHIDYGSTVTGFIDDNTPSMLYAFWGQEGQQITVSMNRGDGDLDPVVSILNADQRRIVSDDDSGGNQNARIERYTLPATGVYYVQAGRYSGADGNPNTSGSFILVLAQRFD